MVSSDLVNPWGINPTGTAIKRVKPETGESIPLGPIFELNQDMALILRNARAYAGYESIEDPQYMQAKQKLPNAFVSISEK